MRTYEQVEARIKAETAVKSKKLKDLSEADILVLKAYGLMQLYPNENNKDSAILFEKVVTSLQKK